MFSRHVQMLADQGERKLGHPNVPHCLSYREDEVMKVEVIPAFEADKAQLRPFLSDYIRELSDYDPSLVTADGVYEYEIPAQYWREPTHRPFWLKADGEAAGFALVQRMAEGHTEMAEFYVRPEFRRRGVGLIAARALIADFSGPWELSEYLANPGAIAFWHKVLEGRAFTEHEYISARGNRRIAQRFVA
jgi:predicted acetyltransferase